MRSNLKGDPLIGLSDHSTCILYTSSSGGVNDRWYSCLVVWLTCIGMSPCVFARHVAVMTPCPACVVLNPMDIGHPVSRAPDGGLLSSTFAATGGWG